MTPIAWTCLIACCVASASNSVGAAPMPAPASLDTNVGGVFDSQAAQQYFADRFGADFIENLGAKQRGGGSFKSAVSVQNSNNNGKISSIKKKADGKKKSHKVNEEKVFVDAPLFRDTVVRSRGQN